MKKVKGKVPEVVMNYLASAKNEKELELRLKEVAHSYLKRTSRKCKECGKTFSRVEDGLLDWQIGDKDLCSMCAKRMGLLKIKKFYGEAG